MSTTNICRYTGGFAAADDLDGEDIYFDFDQQGRQIYIRGVAVFSRDVARSIAYEILRKTKGWPRE